MKQYFKQCKLQMDTNSGCTITTSWIPEKKAVLGNTVYLEPRGGKRTGPWEVVRVGSARMEQKEVLEREQDHKKTRGVSDI